MKKSKPTSIIIDDDYKNVICIIEKYDYPDSIPIIKMLNIYKWRGDYILSIVYNFIKHKQSKRRYKKMCKILYQRVREYERFKSHTTSWTIYNKNVTAIMNDLTYVNNLLYRVNDTCYDFYIKRLYPYRIFMEYDTKSKRFTIDGDIEHWRHSLLYYITLNFPDRIDDLRLTYYTRIFNTVFK
jgi:hypothetical protein